MTQVLSVLPLQPGPDPLCAVQFQRHCPQIIVATLAHELGHGIHAHDGERTSQHLQPAHASLPLAETASTFSEMLLIDRLLSLEEHR